MMPVQPFIGYIGSHAIETGESDYITMEIRLRGPWLETGQLTTEDIDRALDGRWLRVTFEPIDPADSQPQTSCPACRDGYGAGQEHACGLGAR
jgi:hypothetical protein